MNRIDVMIRSARSLTRSVPPRGQTRTRCLSGTTHRRPALARLPVPFQPPHLSRHSKIDPIGSRRANGNHMRSRTRTRARGRVREPSRPSVPPGQRTPPPAVKMQGGPKAQRAGFAAWHLDPRGTAANHTWSCPEAAASARICFAADFSVRGEPFRFAGCPPPSRPPRPVSS